MPWRRKRNENDFSEEIRSHLKLEADRLRAEGLTQSEAVATARRQFGNVAAAAERFYESRRWLWWDQARRDLVYAVRVLSRSPGFTLVAILSLALGIGANALVFSVVNALVLRPLPVAEPDRVVFVEPLGGSTHSFPNYKDIRDRDQAFAGLIGYRMSPMELDSDGGASRIWGYLATGSYFDVLGISPVMGRFFHQEDDLHPGVSPYAVLSYISWQTRFGADLDIVGKTIRINRLPYTVLGVAPPTFHGAELFYWPEVWVPMMMQAQIEAGNPWLDNRATFDVWVAGRLKQGITPERATANLNTIAAELARQYPWPNEGLQFKLTKPGLIGDALGRPVRAFTLGVLALAALVLLAACANLASLLMARASDRQREIAIRLSVGASRSRVVRQMLTETLVLSAAGGAAGILVARVLSGILSQWHAPLDFPVQFKVTADWRVLGFGLAASLLAGILFGSAPAWHASRTDAHAALKGAQIQWDGTRLAFRDVLVVLQVTLCFVLVSGCLVSLRGLQHSLAMDLGFRPQGVTVAAFELGLAGYDEERGRTFQRRVLEAVEHLPGVTSAAWSNSVPLSIDQSHNTAYPDDRPNPRPADAVSAVFYEVSPRFLATMGIDLLAGRDFGWHDDRHSTPVAIVNVAFAKQVLRTQNALGRHFRIGPRGPLTEVIGIIKDGKYESLTESSKPVIIKSILQSYNTTTTLEIRSSIPEARMVQQVRQTIATLDPNLPLYGVGSLEQMLGFAFFPSRAAALMLSAFGLLAIMLAVTGIHGLVSYAVARRVREIGIRTAVGARPIQVLRLILGRVMLLLATGSAIGLILAIATGQVLASIVYQASPRDPFALVAVLAAILLLGLISSWAPARRALRIEPVSALRHE